MTISSIFNSLINTPILNLLILFSFIIVLCVVVIVIFIAIAEHDKYFEEQRIKQISEDAEREHEEMAQVARETGNYYTQEEFISALTRNPHLPKEERAILAIQELDQIVEERILEKLKEKQNNQLS